MALVKEYFHLLGEAAARKCLRCRYHEYRPRSVGKPVAFDTEAIKCMEGVFGLPPKSQRRWSINVMPDLWWYTLSTLKSPNSQAREKILACEFWDGLPRTKAQR